jgi:hypothetical protein
LPFHRSSSAPTSHAVKHRALLPNKGRCIAALKSPGDHPISKGLRLRVSVASCLERTGVSGLLGAKSGRNEGRLVGRREAERPVGLCRRSSEKPVARRKRLLCTSSEKGCLGGAYDRLLGALERAPALGREKES